MTVRRAQGIPTVVPKGNPPRAENQNEAYRHFQGLLTIGSTEVLIEKPSSILKGILIKGYVSVLYFRILLMFLVFRKMAKPQSDQRTISSVSKRQNRRVTRVLPPLMHTAAKKQQNHPHKPNYTNNTTQRRHKRLEYFNPHVNQTYRPYFSTQSWIWRISYCQHKSAFPAAIAKPTRRALMQSNMIPTEPFLYQYFSESENAYVCFNSSMKVPLASPKAFIYKTFDTNEKMAYITKSRYP